MSARRVLLGVMAAVTAVVSTGCSGCRAQRLDVPEPVYREAVSAFYTGLAALQTSQEPLARQKFERVIALVPGEPAAWANLGLLLLRQQELEGSLQRLARAAELAPDSAEIAALQGLAESRKGDPAAAIGHWKRALELDPGDLRSAFALGQETARQGGDQSEAEAQRVFAGLVQRSGNLVARLELARLAAKRGDAAGLQQALAPLAEASRAWPEEARAQLSALQTAARTDPRSAATRVTFLKNVLQRVPEYRLAYAALTTPLEALGQPIMRLLALRTPAPQPAPADDALRFSVQQGTEASWAGAFSASGEGRPVVLSAGSTGLMADGQAVRVQGNGAWSADPADTVLPVDLNYDFLVDLAVAGPRGLRILRQDTGGSFTDVTATTTLPATVTTMPMSGVWAADVDLDGDLDLMLAPTSGAPLELRNNNDGTFTSQSPFAGTGRVRGFAWADLDGDGVPDAALLEETGAIRVWLNQRGFGFSERRLPASIGPVVAVAAADVSDQAAFDLVTVSARGDLARLTLSGEPATTSLARVEVGDAALAPGTARVLVADLDNNGAADLVIGEPRASHIVLGAPGSAFRPLRAAVPMSVTSADDLDGDGRLELVGVANGHVARATSAGPTRYHWQVYRPRAANTLGDQRINSFGIGGEVEVRTGLHAQKQAIASPLVHFGLGEATRADVVRITWPNGMLQSEFDRPVDAVVTASQRLKGSCPWLFAWNGREMAFVTDLIWRSPLGLRINAQDTAHVAMTEDRVRIPAGALAPRGGAYDLRITAELWETHFFDLVSLRAVDHPAGTEVFFDERFAVPPPSLAPVVTEAVQPFAAARDDRGLDVATEVRERDDRYLDTAGRGAYQGITRDHFVELDLPADAPRSGALWLVAQGWIHPTDSSINVAISQGAHPRPRGLSLDVLDTSGRFRTVAGDLGFPAGKDKTVLIDLRGVFPRSGPRRLRLSTNLEIYWDRLGWAVGRADAVRITPLPLTAAALRYRGYSVTDQRDASTPERPRYTLAGTTPRWLDLEGYYTRFGDVRPLLAAADDRYVIMNAGDELLLRFAPLPVPRPGMVRDFVAVSDGWVKDGDFNTTASRTVLPLPTHASGEYARQPGRLEEDPVYRAHPQDFHEYHTRFVMPMTAREALHVAAGRE